MSAQYADIVQFLGNGAFGMVMTVRRKSDGRELVCKKIVYQQPRFAGAFPSRDSTRERVERECKILRGLQHPHIVQYVHHILEDMQDPPCCNLYMELCKHRDLSNYITTEFRKTETFPTEQSVWDIANQLSSALAFCHEGATMLKSGQLTAQNEWKPILHRDIKPANVFIAERAEDKIVVKLGDFGLGAMLTDSRNLSTYAGTTIYIPPEITRSSSKWSPKSDIFSLGCLLFEYATLAPPFNWHIESEKDLPDPPRTRCSESLSDLIMSCLKISPENRPKASKLLQDASKKLASMRPDGEKASSSGFMSLLETIYVGFMRRFLRFDPAAPRLRRTPASSENAPVMMVEEETEKKSGNSGAEADSSGRHTQSTSQGTVLLLTVSVTWLIAAIWYERIPIPLQFATLTSASEFETHSTLEHLLDFVFGPLFFWVIVAWAMIYVKPTRTTARK